MEKLTCRKPTFKQNIPKIKMIEEQHTKKNSPSLVFNEPPKESKTKLYLR
jgi:hypothetical protein